MPFHLQYKSKVNVVNLHVNKYHTSFYFVGFPKFQSVYDYLRLQFTANRVLADGMGKYHDRLCGPIPPVWNMWLEMALNTS